jgi:hypothetical protein
LDGIPGILAWTALGLCIVFAIVVPHIMLVIAAALALYSMLRFLLAGIATIMGTRRIRRWQQMNWRYLYQQTLCDGTLAWDSVHHVILIPNYQEDVAVLRASLRRLSQASVASQMTIVLAMEERENNAADKGRTLCEEFAPLFAGIELTLHPDGLPGEIRCKSSNQAWAARQIRRKLIEGQGVSPEHIVVTTMDADTLWHPEYFAALTYLFTTNPNRYRRFWQAPVRYHTNVWQINPLLRLIHAYSSAFELAYLAGRWWQAMPISSYSLSLRLLEDSGYWDGDVISDEWHMYIKAFFETGGSTSLDPIYLPFSAYATTGDTLLQAFRNRYNQTLRHAWGSKEVGYIVARTLGDRTAPIGPALRLFIRVAHDILLSGAGWIIVTAGSVLPLLIHPNVRNAMLQAQWRDPVFSALQISFGIAFVLGVAIWHEDLRARPQRPSPGTLGEHALTALSFALLSLLTLILVALPALHAQTRLMFGIPLEFRVSRKV